jgi:hypothetical protein
MNIKAKLSKFDTEYFKTFKERYSGWDIVRYEDNSLEFIKPVRFYKKQERIKYIDK